MTKDVIIRFDNEEDAKDFFETELTEAEQKAKHPDWLPQQWELHYHKIGTPTQAGLERARGQAWEKFLYIDRPDVLERDELDTVSSAYHKNWDFMPYKERAEQLKTHPEAKLRYRVDELAQTLAQYQKRHHEYDEAIAQPLIDAYVAWAESKTFLAYFQCNFDPKDIANGAAYLECYLGCVTGAVDNKATIEMIVRGFHDPDSPLMRALCFNQDAVWAQVKKYTNEQSALMDEAAALAKQLDNIPEGSTPPQSLLDKGVAFLDKWFTKSDTLLTVLKSASDAAYKTALKEQTAALEILQVSEKAQAQEGALNQTRTDLDTAKAAEQNTGASAEKHRAAETAASEHVQTTERTAKTTQANLKKAQARMRGLKLPADNPLGQLLTQVRPGMERAMKQDFINMIIRTPFAEYIVLLSGHNGNVPVQIWRIGTASQLNRGFARDFDFHSNRGMTAFWRDYPELKVQGAPGQQVLSVYQFNPDEGYVRQVEHVRHLPPAAAARESSVLLNAFGGTLTIPGDTPAILGVSTTRENFFVHRMQAITNLLERWRLEPKLASAQQAADQAGHAHRQAVEQLNKVREQARAGGLAHAGAIENVSRLEGHVQENAAALAKTNAELTTLHKKYFDLTKKMYNGIQSEQVLQQNITNLTERLDPRWYGPFALVNIVMGTAACLASIDRLKTAGSGEETLKALGNAVMLVGAVADASQKLLFPISRIANLKFVQALNNSKTFNWLAGRGSAPALVIYGAFDVGTGFVAIKEGEAAWGGALFGSGAAGIAGGVIILCNPVSLVATAAAGVLIGISMGLGLVANFFLEPEKLNEYLKHCHFGVYSEGWPMEEETKQYWAAMASQSQ